MENELAAAALRIDELDNRLAHLHFMYEKAKEIDGGRIVMDVGHSRSASIKLEQESILEILDMMILATKKEMNITVDEVKDHANQFLNSLPEKTND